MKITTAAILILSFLVASVSAQTDATTPLHLLKPDYPIPYGIPKQEDVTAVLYRVHGYLNGVTPPGFQNEKTGELFTDASKIDQNTILQRGDFRIVSYEWGVTYAGMLLASEATGDARYREYVEKRLAFIAASAAVFRKPSSHYEEWEGRMPLRNLLNPRTLDDTGAMSAAMIKATRGGNRSELRPIFERGLNHIMTGQYRLADGTLARNRPQPNTLWLDDMFMSVPAIAQMGKLTGDNKYYDEATKQVLSFAAKMFNPEKGVFMHGWVESMPTHPEFRWARANGWAFMALAELLEVLPENHPNRGEDTSTLSRSCARSGVLPIGQRILAPASRPPRFVSRNIRDGDLRVCLRTRHQSRMDRREDICSDDTACVECGHDKGERQRPGRGHVRRYRNGIRSGVLLPSPHQLVRRARIRPDSARRSRSSDYAEEQEV